MIRIVTIINRVERVGRFLDFIDYKQCLPWFDSFVRRYGYCIKNYLWLKIYRLKQRPQPLMLHQVDAYCVKWMVLCGKGIHKRYLS